MTTPPLKAVSYTHLDVYKRQAQGSRAFVGGPAALRPGHGRAPQWRGPHRRPSPRRAALAAVSYTHLDVYKRQIKDLIRRGGRVILDDLGRFEARWNETRTVRSVGFAPSPGFIAGTRAGYPLTDAQAKALNP